MCRLCDEGKPQDHASSNEHRWNSRRGFLKAGGAGTVAAGAMAMFHAPAAEANDDREPEDSGQRGRRYVIRGGAVMSVDPKVGDFAQADVLVEGKKILAVGPNLNAGGAGEIDARGRIVMPGFVDTHHHLFETALRSFLADGLLLDYLDPGITTLNYFEKILSTFAPVYRPQDVYISELFGSLSQLDAGVTTVHDISQIHHSQQHSDAAIQALKDSARRAVFGYFESAGGVPGNQYPADARRIKTRYFSSSDQLLSMSMGGEIYLPGYEAAWKIGRELGLPVAAHIVGTFGMRAEFDKLATAGAFGPDNFFIHMTGMSDFAWQKARDAGVAVSLAVPIEMNMAHGTPPIIKALQLGFRPSLSTDVECTLTADLFTQMRTAMALQRMFVNANKLGEANMPPTQGTAPVDHAGCDRMGDPQRRPRPAAGQEGRLADAGQGSRHHHPGRRGDQRRAAEPRARRGRVPDGAQQRRDRDRRRPGAQVEGPTEERQPEPAAPRAGAIARLPVRAGRHPAEPVSRALSPEENP